MRVRSYWIGSIVGWDGGFGVVGLGEGFHLRFWFLVLPLFDVWRRFLGSRDLMRFRELLF